MNIDVITEFQASPALAGKTGKGGEIQITNAEFVASVFSCLPKILSIIKTESGYVPGPNLALSFPLPFG